MVIKTCCAEFVPSSYGFYFCFSLNKMYPQRDDNGRKILQRFVVAAKRLHFIRGEEGTWDQGLGFPRLDIQLFRESLSRIKCTRQSRKVIWDMINTLLLTTVAVEPTFVTFLQHSQTYISGLPYDSFKFL